MHSCKQVLFILSLPLDNKSFSVRPGVKCKLGAKCKTGTANWGWNVDWVETILTNEFKREWEKKNENMQFTLYTSFMQLDPVILKSQCAWLTNVIVISTFSERLSTLQLMMRSLSCRLYWSLPSSTHVLVKHYQGYA